MAFADFRGIWKIKEVYDDSETVNHEIAIGGSDTAVRIFCSDAKSSHKYVKPIYEEKTSDHPERIRVSNQAGTEYQITRSPGTNIILCAPLEDDQHDPGSWTANDNVGGLDGDGGHGRKH